MAYTMVIKVQYRDMLKRFSAEVDENYELVLDMDGLRAKIFSFFGFSPDADLTLTYIDEDGDRVTLADDDDLRDVMKQELDFLMIDVVLNSDKVDKLPIKSSGRRTPLRSPPGPPPLPDHISGHTVAELLKSLPDPLLEGLSELALDSVSKAASSSPLFAELVGLATEMVKNLGSRSQSLDSGASAGSNASEDESKREELLKDAATTSKVVSNASKDENMPEELLKNATTSKGSNASKDENMPKELPKCDTSKVDESSRPKENATSTTMPKELLKCATSKASNASTVTSVTTAPLHLTYIAGAGSPLSSRTPHMISAPPIALPFGAPPTRPPPPPLASSNFGAPPPRKPQPVMKIQNNNPFVYSSLSSFVPPNKSASEGSAFGAASTIPASSSYFSVSSSSSAPRPVIVPAYGAYAPLPPPPYGSGFGPYSRSYASPDRTFFGASSSSSVPSNGASSSHYVPPKGQ